MARRAQARAVIIVVSSGSGSEITRTAEARLRPELGLASALAQEAGARTWSCSPGLPGQ